ncbi:uncharacterized protein B0H18DRAFT_439216 [Fomitopsis serialis]|uniref:uncharacterized protein n=1 Tax=Fomitopsis serialis TaxID=139415 RepID=UPI0020089A38|nr:uncharacterized protein B0H18DRAFT_439216 [Neoantrodia serialis]KAH9924221.1 hypothetical protein B0H18DRAFT_439216 [Neoantrodia serialis]
MLPCPVTDHFIHTACVRASISPGFVWLHYRHEHRLDTRSSACIQLTTSSIAGLHRVYNRVHENRCPALPS